MSYTIDERPDVPENPETPADRLTPAKRVPAQHLSDAQLLVVSVNRLHQEFENYPNKKKITFAVQRDGVTEEGIRIERVTLKPTQ